MPEVPSTKRGKMKLDLSTITRWLADIAQPIHKYAALAIALLAGLGITPGSPTDERYTLIVCAAYAAIVHAFDALTGKAAPPAA